MSKNYKAIEYVRLSYTDDKTNESDSVANQKTLIENFVKASEDIEVVSVKVDDGFSGVLFDRPAFQEMMDEIKAGNANCVIVKDLSRLGREYIETGRYLRRIFPAYGVRFIAINDNIDSLKDEGDELNVTLKNLLNDAYCHDISKKTRCSLATKRKSGDYVGACAVYGYQKSESNHNQLVVDDYAAQIIRDIFAMKIDGASAVKIAEELNRRGILSPISYKKRHGLPHPKGGFADREGAKWSPNAIFRILKDETYIGTLVQGKQTTHNHKIKALIDVPVSEWVRVENAHEAIIEPHNFDLVQKILRLDTRTAPGGDKVYLFSGILLCGCCGARMTRKISVSGNNRYYYYYCRTGKNNGCKEPVMLKEEDLASCVLDSLKAHINNVATLEELVHDSGEQRIARTLIAKYTKQMEENSKRIQENFHYKSGLYENFIAGLISNENYRDLRNTYDRDIQKLKTANALLTEELEAVRNNTGERLRWIEHFKRFSTMLELDRRAVIQLIDHITVVNKTCLDIHFRYEAEFENAIQLLQERTASSLPVDREEVV